MYLNELYEYDDSELRNGCIVYGISSHNCVEKETERLKGIENGDITVLDVVIKKISESFYTGKIHAVSKKYGEKVFPIKFLIGRKETYVYVKVT
jgi:hypothetical protein